MPDQHAENPMLTSRSKSSLGVVVAIYTAAASILPLWVSSVACVAGALGILYAYRVEVGFLFRLQLNKLLHDTIVAFLSAGILLVSGAGLLLKSVGYFEPPAAASIDIAPVAVVPVGPAPSERIALSMTCEMTGLPLTAEANSTLYFIPAERGIANKWATFLEIQNRSAKPMIFPSASVARKLNSVVPAVVTKCILSNHGEASVLSVAIPISMTIDHTIMPIFQPRTPPIDAGHEFVFYIANDCPNSAMGVIQDHVLALVAGQEKYVSAPLNSFDGFNDKNSTFILFPSSVRWLQSAVCP